MKNVTVDVETLIHEIQEMKRMGYEQFPFSDGLENPVVLAQVTSRTLGVQSAYDSVIKYLMGLQGCDSE